MAVTIEREHADTGLVGDHWVLTTMHIYREGNTNNFTLSSIYSLYASQASYEAGKKALTSVAVQVPGALAGNPTLGQLQATLDVQASAVDSPLRPAVQP